MRLAGGIISKRCLSGTEKQRPLSGRHLLTKATTLHQRSSGKSFKRDCQKKEGSGEALFDVAFGALEVGTAAKLSFKALGNFFKKFIPNAAETKAVGGLSALEEPIAAEPNWGELMEPVDETPITDPEVLLTARETDNLDETLANADFNPDGLHLHGRG
jgi:hypothetical protein